MSHPRSRRATITDVARRLGVNKSTVSRAFNEPHVLLPETVTRVREASLELGYRPSRAARELSTGVNRSIAVVVPDIANPFFPRLIRAMQTTADACDRSCLLGDSNETAEREWALVTGFAPDVHGVVLMSPRLSASRITELAGLTNLVLVNRDVPRLRRVLLDTSAAYGAALEHLYDLGHRRFAYLDGPARSWSHAQRLAAVTAFAQRHDVEVTVRTCEPATYEGGAATALEVIEQRPTALLCYDDVVAQGAVATLSRAGLAVPRDVSVVGCDNTLAPSVFPRLATIAVDYEGAGRAALALLDPEIAERLAIETLVRTVLAGSFLPGESIAPPARATPGSGRPGSRSKSGRTRSQQANGML